MDFSDKRVSYEKAVLSQATAPKNPFELVQQWLQEAIESKALEPYAMSIATCGNDKMPSVRTVLLRELTAKSVIFYTNYMSDKGQDIAENPQAECLFFWHEMQRQIRLRGQVRKVSRETTEAYFRKRPRESQLGAWVSQPQSGAVESRETMDDIFQQLKNKYPEGSTVPVPDFWGGYELYVEEIEFWQGRPNRLHDRLLFSKVDGGQRWEMQRLLP